MSRPWVKGRIDTSTGRNKRDKSTRRDKPKKASPRRHDGKIVSRAASMRKMGTERALRRRARNN